MANDPVDVFQLYKMMGPDDCWPWLGNFSSHPRERRPYFMAHGRRQTAYRWVYELVHGVTLTADQLVLHSCDNGRFPIGCGNPAHLRVGTTQDNSNDMMDRNRHGIPATVVRAILRLLDQGVTQQDIADRYGLARTTVSSIATQKTHRHVSKD